MEEDRREILAEITRLSQEIGLYDEKSRKCRRCGRINTHRIRDGVLWCIDKEANEDDWEDIN